MSWTCSTCSGSGTIWKTPTCYSCGGSGRHYSGSSCMACGGSGTGSSLPHTCSSCGGTGLSTNFNYNSSSKKYFSTTSRSKPTKTNTRPSLVQDKITKYEGEKMFFKPNGAGIATHKSGLIYKGEWRFGRWSGQGILTFPGKWIYRGCFRNGMLHGKGTLTLDIGHVFKARFKKSRPSGKAALIYADGSTFIGKWKDELNAVGVFIDENGKRLSAKIEQGLITGKRGLFAKRKKCGECNIKAVLAGDV